MAVKIPTKESGVLRACLDLLAAEKIFHRRWNTGAVKAGNRFYRFGKPGDGDILTTPMSRLKCNDDHWNHLYVLWIECKSDSGKQTEEQAAFEREVSEQGHHYLLVRDVDTLKQWLKEHGVL